MTLKPNGPPLVLPRCVVACLAMLGSQCISTTYCHHALFSRNGLPLPRARFLFMGYGLIVHNAPKKSFLSSILLGNFCTILYFVNNPLGTPDRSSLCLLCTPVNYAQPGYAVTIYGIKIPVLSSNRFKEWYPSTCFDEHTCTCLQVSHDSVNSREDME